MLSREIVVNLIGQTTTTKGLRIHAAPDENDYPAGVKVSDEMLADPPSNVTTSTVNGTTD